MSPQRQSHKIYTQRRQRSSGLDEAHCDAKNQLRSMLSDPKLLRKTIYVRDEISKLDLQDPRQHRTPDGGPQKKIAKRRANR